MIKNKLIVFDYDGVIADSLPLWISAFEKGGIMNNIPLRLDKNILDRIDYISVKDIIKDAGIENDERIPSYISDINNAFNISREDVKLFKGINKLIENLYLAENIVCINTLSETDLVRKKFEQENIFQFISDIAGVDVKGNKSEKTLAFMKKYSFSSKDTFIIGDSTGDIIEGKKAGVTTIAVAYGWHTEKKLLSQKPDYLLSSVEELGNFFQQI
ncbi:MAG: HAD hydrolase-like protein [Spirochaetaceae bacterium]|nr:HAD hydrolase-like protein [Spirochaetaceae bacterium]